MPQCIHVGVASRAEIKNFGNMYGQERTSAREKHVRKYLIKFLHDIFDAKPSALNTSNIELGNVLKTRKTNVIIIIAQRRAKNRERILQTKTEMRHITSFHFTSSLLRA